jgi:hypothetical protein
MTSALTGALKLDLSGQQLLVIVYIFRPVPLEFQLNLLDFVAKECAEVIEGLSGAHVDILVAMQDQR